MPTTDVTKPSETTTELGRPIDLFDAMRDEMNRMFGRLEAGFGSWPSRWLRANGEAPVVPRLDVKETKDAISIDVDLPGVAEKDVLLTLTDGILTIRGEKKQEREEKRENYYLAERTFGSFERSLRLPQTIDETKVEAKLDKGVLKITAPKRPEAVKAERRIEIKKS